MSQLPQTLHQMIITKVYLHERGDSSPDEDHNAQPSHIIIHVGQPMGLLDFAWLHVCLASSGSELEYLVRIAP